MFIILIKDPKDNLDYEYCCDKGYNAWYLANKFLKEGCMVKILRGEKIVKDWYQLPLPRLIDFHV